jgi:hypothetical protein
LQNPHLLPAYANGLNAMFDEGGADLESVLADIEAAWQQLDDA